MGHGLDTRVESMSDLGNGSLRLHCGGGGGAVGRRVLPLRRDGRVVGGGRRTLRGGGRGVDDVLGGNAGNDGSDLIWRGVRTAFHDGSPNINSLSINGIEFREKFLQHAICKMRKVQKSSY